MRQGRDQMALTTRPRLRLDRTDRARHAQIGDKMSLNRLLLVHSSLERDHDDAAGAVSQTKLNL